MTTYTEWQQWRACTRKTGRWQSKLAASTAALRIWVTGEYVQPYRCKWCGAWHLTSERGEVEL
jgi:hypothetical protein